MNTIITGVVCLLLLTASIVDEHAERTYDDGRRYAPPGSQDGGSWGRHMVARSAVWHARRWRTLALVLASTATMLAFFAGGWRIVALVGAISFAVGVGFGALRMLGIRGRRDHTDWSR